MTRAISVDAIVVGRRMNRWLTVAEQRRQRDSRARGPRTATCANCSGAVGASRAKPDGARSEAALAVGARFVFVAQEEVTGQDAIIERDGVGRRAERGIVLFLRMFRCRRLRREWGEIDVNLKYSAITSGISRK